MIFSYNIGLPFHDGITILLRGTNIGTRERKQRELAMRKKLILEKSKELFFLHGFNNVSIQDICEAIEYGRSSVYGIFSSKEEIYGHIYVEAMKILADLINNVDSTAINPLDVFKVFTREIYVFLTEYRPYYNALFFFDYNHVAFSKIPDYLIELKYKEKERAVSPVRKVIQKGSKEKVLRDFDVDMAIDIYFASTLGIINMFIVNNPDSEIENIYTQLKQHAEVYDRGIAM